MKMRILFAGLTLAALTISASPAHAKNILVIIADDLGVDKVNAYAADYPGYAPAFLPNTQAIDSLAAKGLRFTRAWSTPLCSPTRASFQTGVFPFRHGIGYPLVGDDEGLDLTQFQMLADSFANAGYGYTTGYFGKWHIGTKDAMGHTGTPDGPFTYTPHPALAGWDRFFGTLDGDIGDYKRWKSVGWLKGGTGYTMNERTHATTRTAAVALNWINSRTTNWLAVVAFHAPHSASGKHWTYDDIDDPTQVRSTEVLACLTTSSCGANRDKAVYQALVEHMDLKIAVLLNNMDQAVLDDTLIIFFGDNGTPNNVQESLFAGEGLVLENLISVPPSVRGKGTVYENGIRVPLIVADGRTWLNGTAGTIETPGLVVEEGVNIMDVFQTIHNHGLSRSLADVNSRSFIECFTTTDIYCDRPGDSYGYSETFEIDVDNGSISSAQIAVRYGNDKMIASYKPDLGCLEETFYETATDPFERTQQTWPGLRANRLRNYFKNLHTPHLTSWAYANGPLVDFCP